MKERQTEILRKARRTKRLSQQAVANMAYLNLREYQRVETGERGMDRLMQERTTFVIAHRLSTVRNANAIMVLENGEIIERGDHDDLLAMKGRYYELYTGKSELT